jgi:hypothetical protein
VVPLDEHRIRRSGHDSAVDNRFHHSGTTYEDAVCISEQLEDALLMYHW